MKKRIVTLGEIMMRLVPMQEHGRLRNAEYFHVVYGGGEANVAVSLCNYGDQGVFVTKVPDHEIGQAAVDALNRYSVDTSFVARGGDRLGIYYSENGASVRPSKVIYDRAYSAIAEAGFADFEWDAVFAHADWFHWSGITPAISDNAAKLVKEACIVAKKYGVTISCDLNYRGKLWASEKAQKVMTPLMDLVDVCIGNEEDAAKCLGFVPEGNVDAGRTDAEGYYEIFKQMHDKFRFKYIASTLRESHSASDNGWKALLYDGSNFYESRHYEIVPIVDRVGAGDSFSGGLIHGLLHWSDLQKVVDFATAASALKQTLPGDFNCVSETEALALASGNGNGRVLR